MVQQLRNAPVVVTMTTLPSRIGLMEPMLRSLVDQTRPPDRVVLATPRRSTREGTGYTIPSFLRDVSAYRDLVDIVVPEDDLGPGTKLLGCLPEIHEPSIIVLADDDVRYRPNFIEDLVDAQIADHRSAFTFYAYRARGLTIGQGCDGYTMWSPHLDGIADWIDAHISQREVFHQDDVWISFFLARTGIRVRGLPLDNPDDELVYQQVHEVNSLQHLSGDLERHSVTRKAVDHLMRHGEPTLPMRLTWTAARAGDAIGLPRVRRVARRVGRRALSALPTRQGSKS